VKNVTLVCFGADAHQCHREAYEEMVK